MNSSCELVRIRIWSASCFLILLFGTSVAGCSNDSQDPYPASLGSAELAASQAVEPTTQTSTPIPEAFASATASSTARPEASHTYTPIPSPSPSLAPSREATPTPTISPSATATPTPPPTPLQDSTNYMALLDSFWHPDHARATNALHICLGVQPRSPHGRLPSGWPPASR